MPINAKIICDSISPQNIRLTTFLLRYPKFIHGEFMTHRVFSRNASSSRAVPVEKNLAEVRSDELRACPVWWGAEQKGMASGEELDNEDKFHPENRGYYRAKSYAQESWTEAAHSAAIYAERLHNIGAHKSIVNRILEPFLHINVLCTATEYMNFFGLRLDTAAQPEIRVLAEMMWKEWNESAPQPMKAGSWHLPFIDDNTWTEIQTSDAAIQYHGSRIGVDPVRDEPSEKSLAVRCSVARCARLSYTSFETKKHSTIDEDLKLYDRLVGSQPLHASPAEHQATPDVWENAAPETALIGWQHAEQHGNFTGWRQYRKMLPGEAVAPLPPGYIDP